MNFVESGIKQHNTTINILKMNNTKTDYVHGITNTAVVIYTILNAMQQ
jgi:hypothetical protein